jgi:hypothetical protein
MGNPTFRFTLSHQQHGTQEISEPGGWMNTVLKLERHPDYHSLVEYFEGAFVFYGDNGEDNGGIDFIRAVETLYGVDAVIIITIDISFDDGGDYELIFAGQLQLEGIQELKNNKAEIPIIRNDLWANFIARRDTPVNVLSPTNLDDGPANIVNTVSLNLPSQKIRYVGQYNWTDSVTYEAITGQFGVQLDWDEVIIDDLKKFTLPQVTYQLDSGAYPAGIHDLLISNFEAPYTGDYTFEVRIEAAEYIAGNWAAGANIPAFYVQKDSQKLTFVKDGFTQTNVTYGSDTIAILTFTKKIRLLKGDQIAIYGVKQGAADRTTIFGTRRLAWKPDAVVATTGPITLSGFQVIDGYSILVPETVLVKNQADPSENGIWISDAGAWFRSSTMDTVPEFNNAAIYVTSGTVNANTAWRQDNNVREIGEDDVIWVFMIPSDERFRNYPGTTVDNHLIIYGDTVYRDTDIEPLLLHDVGGSIIDRVTGQNDKFYSELLGSTQTSYRQYVADGCQWKYVLAQGLQLRGYSLTEKQFSMSFNKWWNGINPILNLGLGYEVVDGVEVIRVEEKGEFYNSATSVDIDNIYEITRQYDNQRIFNKIEIGYTKWQAEDISGIDDPQSKHIYASPLKKSGTPIIINSEFIAASLAIEITRRQTILKNTDYKFDNDVFIIAIGGGGGSPDMFEPELNGDFDTINNLLNYETRYNLRLTPARNLLRWLNYLNGGLQLSIGGNYKFTYGEGNYNMQSEMVISTPNCDVDYDGVLLAENADIPITNDFFHSGQELQFEIDLSWDEYLAIRNNRKNAIGISQTSTGHVPCFIKLLEYEIVNSKAKFTVWPVNPFTFQVPEFTPDFRVCESTDECDDALTDLLGEILTDELGECITS